MITLSPALFVGFVGCSKVRLSETFQRVETVSAESPFYLTAPEPLEGPRRFVFFIDMSFSMVSEPCATDVDGIMPAVPGAPCAQDKGVDPMAHRLDAVSTWLNQIENQFKRDADVMIALVPFTGGVYETRREVQDPPVSFVDLSQARDQLVKLRDEHQKDLSASRSAGANQYMGTSVPARKLQLLSELLLKNMKEIQAQGKLHATSYRVVALTDGVPTPIKENFQTAFELRECPLTCLTDTTACNKACSADLNKLKDYWGEPDENTIEAISQSFSTLLNLPLILGEGRVQLDLIQLHPENMPQEDLLPDRNYLTALSGRLPELKSYVLNSEKVPFDIISSQPGVENVKLVEMYALNLHVRLDEFERLSIDSDADGLFDYQEEKFGTDPLNPRSGNGKCLDIIAVKQEYAGICARPLQPNDCDPELDVDGDGLNQCEEIILGLSPLDFDTDNDGIPDGLEVIYSHFLRKDDSVEDSNSDGLSNLRNFAQNLMPHHDVGALKPEYKTVLSRKRLGTKNETRDDGTQVQVEGYDVTLDSAPVKDLLFTVAPKTPKLFRSSRKGAEDLIARGDQLLGVTLDGGNRLLILARISEATSNNRMLWSLHTIPTPTNDQFQNLKIDISKLRYIPVRDPIESVDAFKRGFK
ncbi:MAG: hypothetical protein COT74_02145 [Bdellovibrionales bacterium CG10_big_fil_rev_8_21_14_0_10_45_34]|nr:MAG: hypothetical protein COT74_02145 [Bdellovibrionales bacterium CG10_big_fil_rev_8_21_14_0_10_45_34]